VGVAFIGGVVSRWVAFLGGWSVSGYAVKFLKSITLQRREIFRSVFKKIKATILAHKLICSTFMLHFALYYIFGLSQQRSGKNQMIQIFMKSPKARVFGASGGAGGKGERPLRDQKNYLSRWHG